MRQLLVTALIDEGKLFEGIKTQICIDFTRSWLVRRVVALLRRLCDLGNFVGQLREINQITCVKQEFT